MPLSHDTAMSFFSFFSRRKPTQARVAPQVEEYFEQLEKADLPSTARGSPTYPISNPVDSVRAMLGGFGPGWWASRHDEEALHNTGWTYIATHAKAKMASQAIVSLSRHKQAIRGGNIVKSDQQGKRLDTEQLPNNHPLLRMIRRPNKRFSGEAFLYQIEQQKCLTGGALIWVVFNGLNLPCELWVLPTALARPMPPTEHFPEGCYWLTTAGTFGQQSFAQWGIGNLSGMSIDARSVIRIGWPHSLFVGDWQSPLAAMSLQIDTGEEIDRATFYAMQNDVDASLVLSVVGNDVQQADIDRIQANIAATKAGTRNRGKTLVLKGVEANKTARTAQEIDYVQGRDQAMKIGLMTHQVAPIAAGAQEPGAYAAYYAALLQTTELSLRPDLKMTAGGLSQYLCPYFDSETFLEIDPPSIQDPSLVSAEVQLLGGFGSITHNEARAKFNYPPNEEWGNERIGQQAPEQPTTQPASIESIGGNTAGNDVANQNGQQTGIRHPALRAVLNNLPSRN